MVLGTPVPMSLPLSMPRPRVLFPDPHPVPTASSLTASPWSTSQGLCLLPLSRVLVPSPLLCCDVYSPVCPPATFPGPALPKPPINPPHQPQPATCWALHQTLRDDRNTSTLTRWTVKLRLLMPPAEVSRPLWTWGARERPGALCWWRWVLLPPARSGSGGLTLSGLCPGTKLIVGLHWLQVCGKQMRWTDPQIFKDRCSEHFFG